MPVNNNIRMGKNLPILPTAKTHFNLLTILAIGCISFLSVYAAEQQVIKWNENAISTVLNKNELTKHGRVFPAWKIKQTTWPSVTELGSKKIIVDEKLNVSCIRWLEKFITKEYLPADMNKHLVAMKNWGLIKKESEQKQLCDVFITRFRKGPYTIHIQESPYNVVITVADDRAAKGTWVDQKDLVFKIGATILKEELKPDPKSERLFTSEIVHDEHKISSVRWILESVIRKHNGQEVIDVTKACEIGASSIKAETDGRFVRFEIRKEVLRGSVNPYIERFEPDK
ncbi:MAG: hypothetical protein ACYTBV_14785 [Planctomycetota bacterium]